MGLGGGFHYGSDIDLTGVDLSLDACRKKADTESSGKLEPLQR